MYDWDGIGVLEVLGKYLAITVLCLVFASLAVGFREAADLKILFKTHKILV